MVGLPHEPTRVLEAHTSTIRKIAGALGVEPRELVKGSE
jgi:hypothetical protein